jgi:hypothetical protein
MLAEVRGTRKDAERELTRRLRTVDTGEHVYPSRMTVARLTPSDIQRAYNSFSRNPSPRTRRHIHRILKSALARAVEQQALASRPISRCVPDRR